nr:hypothetical protein [Tanacetum cinerariifolium]
MSDSEHSTITYTSISSDDGSLDVGSSKVILLGYDRLPMMPEDPYAYVEAAMQEPPSPDFDSKPVYLEFMPPKDDVLPAEEQPLPVAVLPTADSPGYITESDLEEDLEEEDDEDPKEDLADYPIDIDDDDEEEESFGDDANNEEKDEEKEDEHLALDDSIPPPAYHTTARMSIRAQTPIPCPSEAEVDRLLSIPTPPSSPLTLLSSPLPRIPSSPFPVPSPPTTSPTDAGAPLGYRAAMIRLRAESPSTSHPLLLPLPIVLPHTRASMGMMRAAALSTYILAPRSETPPSGTPSLLPIPLPTSSPPLYLPFTNCRADVPEVTLPPWKRLCIALGPKFEVKECSSAPTARPTGCFRADYGFVGTMNAEIRRDPDREIVTRLLMFARIQMRLQRRYQRLDDAQDDRLLMSGQLNLLHRDRRSHAHTARFMESEARASREAWVQSMDASDMTRSETTSTTRRGTDSAEDITDSNGSTTKSQNSDDSHNSGMGSKRTKRTARECTYTDFLKCQPMNFKGTEGVVGLTQWFERMESVFNISNCAVKNQVKFATCTLHGVALTWWKSHVKTVGKDAAHSMPWSTLMKMMTARYCPQIEIKKLEIDIWELKVKGTNVASYTQRFQELALIYGRMFLEESDKIKKYVGGLLDMIHGSVMASKPKIIQDAAEFATELMDKKIRAFAERQSENKRKFEDTLRTNQNQQQQNKRQNIGKCNRVGYLARDCRSPTNANIANNQRSTEVGQKATCFKCEAQGNFKRECLKRKNNNHGNQVRNGNAPAKVYVVGNAWTNPNSNVVTARAPYRLAPSEMKKLSNQLQELSDKGFIRPSDKEEAAFQLIKKKLYSGPILALPEGIEDFVVHYDPSHKGLAVVLMQREKVQKPDNFKKEDVRSMIRKDIRKESKACIILNKHTMKVEESLNMIFDESPPPTKLSPLVDDDVGEEEAIENNIKVVNNNNIEDEFIDVDDVINIKKSNNYPLGQVIGNLNQRTLRSQA